MGGPLVGCSRSQAPTTRAPSATDALGGEALCSEHPAPRPLLVEWPAADRASLEAAATGGVVAVQYDGCQMRVISRCEVGGGYDYQGTTRKHDEVRIRDRDALYAKLPLGAARLEGALARDGQLNVALEIVGQRTVGSNDVAVPRDTPDCREATHFVSTMSVGAFALYTGSSLDASATASLAKTDVQAGGELRRSHEVLRTDGDLEACRDAVSGAEAPPEQCGALLRVELTPIDRRGNGTTASAASNDQQRAELESAAHRWEAAQQGTRIGALVLGAGAITAGVFAGVRSIQITSADFDLDEERREANDDVFNSAAERADAQERVEELEADIDSFKRSRRIAGWTGLGLLAGTITLYGVSVGAGKRSDALRRRARLLSVQPVLSPSFSGVSVTGRF